MGEVNMTKYKLFYGVGGSINDITRDEEAFDFDSYDEAINIARQEAFEAFEDYEVICRVLSVEERMQQEGLTEEEAIAEYEEDVESFIEYGAEEVK